MLQIITPIIQGVIFGNIANNKRFLIPLMEFYYYGYFRRKTNRYPENGR
ncbi:ORF156 [Escherichia phage T5]|uniref:ORF005 n=1 Tax=Escherichia phage T5 TaxID=2695836 RepID=Q5DMD8_BPT5|nr:ORF005 [Escherichia phage T5]AAX12093.1 ORF156 [Escherichia phage T5]